MSINEIKDHVESKVQKSGHLKNAVKLIKERGPLTESKVVNGLKSEGISINAAKSNLRRAYKGHQLSRVITVENNRPVWLYFTLEQEPSLNEIKREVWVPLNRLDEYKTTIIREAFNKNKRKWVTLNMVAKRTGFPPSEIEQETYYVARELGIDIIGTQQALEHFKDMTLGLMCIVKVGGYVMTGEPLPREDFLEHALQHIVTGFPEFCDRENFREVVSHLVRSPINFEKLESICEDCGVPQDNDKKKAKELFGRHGYEFEFLEGAKVMEYNDSNPKCLICDWPSMLDYEFQGKHYYLCCVRDLREWKQKHFKPTGEPDG